MLQFLSQVIVASFLFIILFKKPELEVAGELFTSADEVSNWKQIKNHIITSLDKYIEVEESRLLKLKLIENSLHETLESSPTDISQNEQSDHHNLTISQHTAHPVEAFVALNRIVKTIEDIELLFNLDDADQEDGTWLNSKVKLEQMNLSSHLPTREDLQGCGQALIRLQEFYDLKVDDISTGELHPNRTNYRLPDHLQMQADDCFELGKIAYTSEYYSIAIKWFQKALELYGGEEENDESAHQKSIFKYPDLNDILDYMAFSAYKNGQLKFAAEITEFWLNQDPDNERAQNNLDYYLDELQHTETGVSTMMDYLSGNIKPMRSIPSPNREDKQKLKYDDDFIFSSSNYDVRKDEVVRNLCRSPSQQSKLTCTTQILMPHLIFKIETLHENPTILRIHDIVTDAEANRVRELAMPRLKRSTIFSRGSFKLTTSDYRIAKTAWLSAEEDPVITRLNDRVRRLLGLSTEDAEMVQVVNYGSGGYYGPHYDSLRRGKDEEKINDRVATVLIYLNSVDFGGATAFPFLGITVEPIKNSAVIWYNLMRNNELDTKSLHVGCPILLGSKWIATVWPRQDENIFNRPCTLDPDE